MLNPIDMSRSMTCLAGVLAVSACTNSNATLADLPALQVRLLVWEARDFAPTLGSAVLLYDRATFRATRDRDECATLGSLDISLTNAKITDVDHGSSGQERDDDGQWQCKGPGFDFAANFTADEPTTLVVRDESLTITADFGLRLTPHVPTLRSADNWTFAPGEEVVIGWSHPEDIADGPFPYREVWWEGDELGGLQLSPTYAGDEIQFTIPNEISGEHGRFTFHFGRPMVAAVSSVGARCDADLTLGYEHRASIE